MVVRRNRQHTHGFTLLEAMTVIAIVAILVGIGLPSFNGVIERYRIRRTVEDLTATIYLARTEAIKRGGHVILLKDTPAGCAQAATDDAWGCGWHIFVDKNDDGVQGAGEDSIQVSPIPSSGVTVEQLNGKNALLLDLWGRFSENPVGFVVRAGTTQMTALCVQAGGRIQAYAGASSCDTL